MARYTQSIFTVDIDEQDVNMVFMALAFAIDGPGLHKWLSTDASQFFADDIESRFYEEGDVKSGFWKELSDTTIDIRRSYGFGDGPINSRTGELEDFLVDHREYDTAPGFASMDVPGTPGSATLRTKLATAQQGSDNNPLGYGPTPARPVLAVSEMDLATLLESLNMSIIQTVMGASVGMVI